MVLKYYAMPARVQPATTGRQYTPKWGWLYALCLLLIGLLLAQRYQPLTRTGHIVIQCGIVLLVYGLMALWVQANRVQLSSPNSEEKSRIVYIVYPDSVSLQERKN